MRSGVEPDDPQRRGSGESLQPRAHRQLAVELRDVRLHGPRGDAQPTTNLLGGEPLGQQHEDLPLPSRDSRSDRGPLSGLPRESTKLIHQSAFEFGRQHALSPCHLDKDFFEFAQVVLLAHDGRGAESKRFERASAIYTVAEHDRPNVVTGLAKEMQWVQR